MRESCMMRVVTRRGPSREGVVHDESGDYAHAGDQVVRESLVAHRSSRGTSHGAPPAGPAGVAVG